MCEQLNDRLFRRLWYDIYFQTTSPMLGVEMQKDKCKTKYET
jgi:hypothetical protein